MSLTPGNADTLGADVSAAVSGLSPGDSTDPVKVWKAIARVIYSHLLTDITAILAPGTVVTTGGPTTQTGPAAPVPITIS